MTKQGCYSAAVMLAANRRRISLVDGLVSVGPRLREADASSSGRRHSADRLPNFSAGQVRCRAVNRLTAHSDAWSVPIPNGRRPSQRPETQMPETTFPFTRRTTQFTTVMTTRKVSRIPSATRDVGYVQTQGRSATAAPVTATAVGYHPVKKSPRHLFLR